ncbi:MAG: cysteine synthase A [Micavibrio sp.]|nr:MAG: cysteine synthase A [Micavibrio sp.]
MTEFRGKIYDSIADTIGATPLVRLPRLTAETGVHAEILAKLEFFNPLSSVKDRLALALIEAGERDGRITQGTVIIEPTSGNTGIGLAFICAARGYRLILTMPETMSYERRKMLRMFGAELHLTPAEDGMNGAIHKAQELAAKIDNSFIPQQFENPANPDIHEKTTAEEIWQDTGGRVDVLVAGIGTGGTLTGVSRALKAKKPHFRTVAIEPEDSAVLSGGKIGPHKIQGIGPGFVPEILDEALIDEVMTVSNDAAYQWTRKVIAQDGVPVGISGGAALYAAFELGRRRDMNGKQIVVIIPSCAERYLSLPVFADLADEP